jgi:ketosteroid isomerase-like protein
MSKVLRFAIVLLSLVAVSAVPAIPSASGSGVASVSTAERIEELETAWNQAHLHGDVEALDRLWAPELTVIVPGMPQFSKSDLLTMWRSMKVTFTEYATRDVVIHLFGGTAVVTGRLHRARDFGGQTASEDWLFTKTYAEIDGDWKVVAYHASAAPQA